MKCGCQNSFYISTGLLCVVAAIFDTNGHFLFKVLVCLPHRIKILQLSLGPITSSESSLSVARARSGGPARLGDSHFVPGMGCGVSSIRPQLVSGHAFINENEAVESRSLKVRAPCGSRSMWILFCVLTKKQTSVSAKVDRRS